MSDGSIVWKKRELSVITLVKIRPLLGVVSQSKNQVHYRGTPDICTALEICQNCFSSCLGFFSGAGVGRCYGFV